MIDLASALIAPLAKLFLKSCLGEVPADIGDNLLKLGFERLGDRTKARAAKQLAERAAAGVVTSLERFFESERVDLDLLEVAAADLGATVGGHVDAAFLARQQLGVEAIETGLLAARPLDQIYLRDEPERDLYIRLIKALAPRLREIAPKLPRYVVERDTEFFAKLNQVASDTPQILLGIEDIQDKLGKINIQTSHAVDILEEQAREAETNRERYGVNYRKAVLQALDYVEILGLDVERARREVKLSIAYLSLTTRAAGLGRMDYETLLDVLPALGNRLLIEGAAGGGKSTLLRWTAVEAAARSSGEETRKIAQDSESVRADRFLEFAKHLLERDDSDKGHDTPPAVSTLRALSEVTLRGAQARIRDQDFAPVVRLAKTLSAKYWRTRVPFLIRLRHLGEGLPKLDDLPNHLSSALGGPPQNWVRDLLDRGQALLLIDGLDEVPEGAARESVLNSIKQYVSLYDECPVIVASRPKAFDKACFRALGFIEAAVDELTPDQRARFIENWHRALATNLGRFEDDPEITGYAKTLKRTLERQPQIARLATNPLLCAAICALHERNPELLPENEWDLCARLTEMLVELRDRSHGRQKAIRLEEFGAAYQLPYADKRSILARIAEAMVSQRLSTLPREETINHVKSALRELRKAEDLTPESVLDALEARSGVMRGAASDLSPSDDAEAHGAVEFAHNTLKAWLAGLHCLDDNKPRELADLALVSGYDEVIPFAAAAPGHREYARTLIERLLSTADKAKDEDERRRLHILALRSEALAPNLPEDLRARVGQLAGKLFPPKSIDEAQQLAVLGNMALPHLARRPNMSDEQVAASIRCLRLIGTQAADAAIDAYCGFTAPAVLEELAQVRHPLTLPAVLAEVQGANRSPGHRSLEELPAAVKARITDVEPLATLTTLRSLSLGNTSVTDLRPLKALSNLQYLSLWGTEVTDLRPLEGLTNLERLDLRGTEVAHEQVARLQKALPNLDIIG
jgi:hypothetical protein